MEYSETSSEMTLEGRLKAIAYQFVKLYERWSEDRQEAAKQGAELAELVEAFSAQVQHFQELEPQLRQYIASTIQKTTTSAAENVGVVLGKEATRAVDETVHRLNRVVDRAEQTLTRYQQEVVHTQWKVIGISALTTIATALLAVWMLIPKPTLPLSDQQIGYLSNGRLFEQIWPKLSKPEKNHWWEWMKRAESR